MNNWKVNLKVVKILKKVRDEPGVEKSSNFVCTGADGVGAVRKAKSDYFVRDLVKSGCLKIPVFVVRFGGCVGGTGKDVIEVAIGRM